VLARTCLALALAACWIAPAAASEPASLEETVLEAINYVREHPREYADQLRAYRDYFEGDVLFLPGDDNGVVTREGVRAVDEAIDFLERQAPLPPLSAGKLLTLAARDHADEQGPAGATGHVSRDGASPGERVRRRGGGIFVGETISYGAGDADAVVRGFVVDDGVRDRGHRKLIFSQGFRYAGVGCGGHARYRVICVVDYSGTENGAPVLPKGTALFTYRGSNSGGEVASR
jgi:uncharacterized protein YkwD